MSDNCPPSSAPKALPSLTGPLNANLGVAHAPCDVKATTTYRNAIMATRECFISASRRKRMSTRLEIPSGSKLAWSPTQPAKLGCASQKGVALLLAIMVVGWMARGAASRHVVRRQLAPWKTVPARRGAEVTKAGILAEMGLWGDGGFDEGEMAYVARLNVTRTRA